MGEMVPDIGVAVEIDILQEVCKSPYFPIIIDESTDISVTKSLGLCIQYLDSNANVRMRVVKLIEVSQGTADAITDNLFTYLTTTAPVPLEQKHTVPTSRDQAEGAAPTPHREGKTVPTPRVCYNLTCTALYQ